MKISRVQIDNYRNLKKVDVELETIVTLVGENNSGKSNFLRAIALPLSSDDGSGGKRLSWFDINNEAKDDYYTFIGGHIDEILSGSIKADDLQQHIPCVSVTVDLRGADTESYDLKDLLVSNDTGDFVAQIRYRWYIDNSEELLSLVKTLLSSDTEVQAIKLSLLPVEMYRYEIVVPDLGGGHKIPYDTLSRFKHVALPAERDNFAASTERLGSRALIDLFQEKLDPIGTKVIEKGYGDFLKTIRDAAKLDEVINWQDYTETPNAKEFFDKISVLPNMPAMSSILGSIRLGYGDESLALQGLGNRNLILMAVILNSYLGVSSDISLKVVTVEEPEAHLCVNNVLLMASIFKAFEGKDNRTQLVYSTHDAEFVNKVGLDKVVVIHDGVALNLGQELDPADLNYLANNPNTDIFKMFFSRRLVLVEGITEELLIKSYLQTRPDLNEIKVLSFHKGYKRIIEIWKKINAGSSSRLGIVRDFDNQQKAKDDHDALEDKQVCIRTTDGYTLETDIVEAGNNHKLLVEKYGAEYGWKDMQEDELQKDWRNNKKTDVMLNVCHDLVRGNLASFTMPKHIQEVLDFLSATAEPTSDTRGSLNEN